MDWKRAYKINITKLPHPRYGLGKLRVSSLIDTVYYAMRSI